MKKILILLIAFFFILVAPLPRAEALDIYIDDLTFTNNCGGEGSPQNFYWEATWNDELWYPDDPVPHNETFYKVEAPCKVFLGDTFEVRITVTDDNCKGNSFEGTVAGEWKLVDKLLSSPPSSTTVDQGSYFVNSIDVYPGDGTWQRTYMRPTPSADNHRIQFAATDLGKCAGGHSWATFGEKDIVVDPVRPGENTAPVIDAGPDVEIGDNGEQNSTVLAATATDEDDDQLIYRWLSGAIEIKAPAGAGVDGSAPLDLATLAPLVIGDHTFTLEVTDGTDTVTDDAVVTVVDKTPPSMAPVATPAIFWPPNNKMVDVVIETNASDNTGGAVTLSIEVASTQTSGLSKDYEFVGIDQEAGIINIRLRSEREGKSTGRTYTVTVTATDEAGNSASVAVELHVPHSEDYLNK